MNYGEGQSDDHETDEDDQRGSEAGKRTVYKA